MTDKVQKITKDKDGKIVYTKTHGQARLMEAIDDNTITIVTGPAGTGKTFISIAKAIEDIRGKKFEKLILTRPVVESGEHLGFLPGDLNEKISPYMRPLFDSIEDLKHEKEKFNVEISPLAYMRGRTLNNSFIIMDEAQNTTIEQFKMFLTRIGNESKVVITGDIKQIDLEDEKSGLKNFIKKLTKVGIKNIKLVELDNNDVVRNPIVVEILKLYEKKKDNSGN